MELVTTLYLMNQNGNLNKYEILGSERDAKRIFIYTERELDNMGLIWLRVGEIDVDKAYENEFGFKESPLFSYHVSSRPSKDSSYARFLCQNHCKSGD